MENQTGRYIITTGCQTVPRKAGPRSKITWSRIQKGSQKLIPIGVTKKFIQIRMGGPHSYPTKQEWNGSIFVWF